MDSQLGLSKDEHRARLVTVLVLSRLRRFYDDEQELKSDQDYLNDIENAFLDLRYLTQKQKDKKEQMRAAIRVAAYTMRFVIDVLYDGRKDR